MVNMENAVLLVMTAEKTNEQYRRNAGMNAMATHTISLFLSVAFLYLGE